MNIKPVSSFHLQVLALFKRRVKEFYLQPMQYFLLALPFLVIMINVIILETVTGFGDDSENVMDFIYVYIYPIIIMFNFMYISPFFAVASASDRIAKTRYLLNFSGIRPTAYFLGLMLAELMLHLIPCGLIIVFIFLLDVDVLWRHAGQFFLGLYAFALPFIPLSHLIGFIFRQHDSLHKYQLLPIIILFMLSTLTSGFEWMDETALRAISPFKTLNDIIMESLQEEIDKDKKGTAWERMGSYFYLFIAQGLVLYGIVVMIDSIQINWFKGHDSNSNLTLDDRVLLDKKEDVLQLEKETESIWNDPLKTE
mmetsp:Transcript_41163/g.62587  ORF Transcript_41163/g.62587 Transcript_41163/m.62587 type:complete len:310 (-) Transcript_41163:512-1441(-)